DWLPEDGRFEDIVASSVDKAAADEHDRRDLEELGQLADRIEDDDIVPWLGVDAKLGPARHVEARAPRQRLHIVKALRFAGRDDQERAGAHRADAQERFEDGLLLALQRAGGDEDGTVGRNAEVAEHAVAPAVSG